MHQVLGEAVPRTVKQEVELDDEIPYDNFKSAEPAPVATPTPTAEAVTKEEDDTMSYFAKLAAED